MKFKNLKKWLINLSLIFASLVILFVLMEGVLIFYSGEDEGNYGFTKEFFEKHVRYNSHGYRDYEYSHQKPKGVFRILVLGDSQTFGHGIQDLEDTWVKKLEAKLKKRGGNSNIEVLNISGPGWNSDTSLYELFMHGFKFNPDLVILAYYHNDIPIPIDVNCDSSDRKIIPDIKTFKNAKLVGFINFRINRLLEKVGEKPSFADCLNQVYDTVGWEMNKFYLDMMGLSLFIKRIHFMITVIPLIHQLDNSYPLTGPHKKLEEFSKQRDIEFLDLYELGFKNLDASLLRISKTDQHLNQKAGDIVANTLFERLKGLTKYKNISYFNKAFSLKEILNENPLLNKLDNRFNKKHPINNFILNSENEAIHIIGDPNQLTIKKTQKEKNGNKPLSLLEIKLRSSGNFIRQKKVTFNKKSRIPKIREIISKQSDIYTHTIEQIKPNPKGGLAVAQLSQRKYQFDFEGSENQKRIKLEKDIAFPDPKILDKWIFQNIRPPSDKHSKEKLKEMLIGMITQNQNIYNTPDDLKIIEKIGYLESLPSENLAHNFDERILFQTFLVLGRYGAKKYVQLLIEKIEQYEPSLMALNAAKRYRTFIKRSIKSPPAKQRQNISLKIPLQNIHKRSLKASALIPTMKERLRLRSLPSLV